MRWDGGECRSQSLPCASGRGTRLLGAHPALPLLLQLVEKAVRRDLEADFIQVVLGEPLERLQLGLGLGLGLECLGKGDSVTGVGATERSGCGAGLDASTLAEVAVSLTESPCGSPVEVIACES